MPKNIYSFLLVSILLGCQNQERPADPGLNWDKQKSTDLNKELAEQEKIDIQLYQERIPNATFEETGSGLYIWHQKEGTGALPEVGDRVQVHFKISLLDGTICYQTEPDEVNEFVVDKSQVETGVQEAIKKMRQGGKAKLIISSYLGHGLTGDLNKIPPLSPLVIDLELIEIIRR